MGSKLSSSSSSWIFLGVIIILILEENTHVLRLYIGIFRSEIMMLQVTLKWFNQKKVCVCMCVCVKRESKCGRMLTIGQSGFHNLLVMSEIFLSSRTSFAPIKT